MFLGADLHHDYVGARRKSAMTNTWLSERKEILHKIKDQVRLYLGHESDELKTYAQSYKKDLERPWDESDWKEVDVCLQQVQVVLGGDFHPFSQAQRTHLRLLRKLVSERSLILALECLATEDQVYVNNYLHGHTEEKVFLKQVQWEEKWGFPWAHYKPLFDFAKLHKIPLQALNSSRGFTHKQLRKRDKFSAQKIYEVCQQNPEALVYVIYGDLHIAGEHLPKDLKSLSHTGRPLEVARFYLNSEKIYFQLAEKKRENKVEVVKFNDREFCLLTSPPWVKWHSYLMYLEENFDVDLELEEGEEEFGFSQMDHTDHVSDLVKMIAAALSVKVKNDAIEVYSLNDPQALVATRKSLSKEEFKLAHTLIQDDQSFYLPQAGFFYLSKSTVNHAATLAGQYVHSRLSGSQRLLWDFPDRFRSVVWVEAMGFLLSKFVNPKRKAQSLSDLKKQLQAFEKDDLSREPVLLALDQKMIELLSVYAQTSDAKAFVPRQKSSYLHAARFMGEIMGDRYFVLYQSEILDIDNIKALLKKDLESPDFDKFYISELKRLDQLEMGEWDKT